MEYIGTDAFMVLRGLLITLLIFSFSFNADARSKKSRTLKKAKAFHAKKQYTKSNNVIKRAYSFKRTKRIPVELLYLASLNFHKSGKHTTALYFFNQLIKKAYLKKHIRVIKALRRDEVDEVEIPKLLNAVYYYMGMSYYALYNSKKRKVNAKKAKDFFTICDETDFNDKCAEYIENLADKQEVARKSVKYWDFFLTAGSLVFQDKVLLVADAGGAEQDIQSNASTFCYGAGIRYGNAYSGYVLSGCTYSGSATVQGTSPIQLNQSGVPVAGLLLEAGYYIKPVSDQTRLGVTLPIFYKSGAYQAPPGYEIEGKKATKFGLMLNAGWEIWFLELQTKVGHLGDTNLFLLQGVVNF